MNIEPANILACPLDGAPLSRHERQWVCPHNHSFDIARQGYVNLLPVQNKKSKEPGDSPAMIEARTRFLNAGVYAPIAERVNALALQHLPADGDVCVVDAGCGEGYYLDGLRAALAANDRSGSAQLIGLDISKPAVVQATKRSKAITWLVASNTNPALLSGTVDLLLCMFGFPDYGAFARILKPGGNVLLVDAGAEHLLELREIIYPEVRKSPPPTLDKAQQHGFALLDTHTLTFKIDLTQAQLADLLVMTPHLYRATKEGKEAAARLQQLALTVDVVLRVLQRRSD